MVKAGCRGRLTESKIKQLQIYYELAIRQNTVKNPSPAKREVELTVYSMKKNIIAILHHCTEGKDLSRQHRFYPKGESSWYKWQQDTATGTSTNTKEACLPEVFLEVLKPVVISLSQTELLQSCILGTTQNQNESLSALVWARSPKHKHHGYTAVGCAVPTAVCHFHKGAKSRVAVMKRPSIHAGDKITQACEERNVRE